MTVAELIKYLQTMPQNKTVYYDDVEEGNVKIESIRYYPSDEHVVMLGYDWLNDDYLGTSTVEVAPLIGRSPEDPY